eukprot:SAG31_NODE_906_length_11091_cov_22.589065_1_plen_74_part_00
MPRLYSGHYGNGTKFSTYSCIHFSSYVNVLNLRLYYKNVVVILVPVDAQQLCTSTAPRVNLVPRSTSRYRRQT